MLFHTNSLNSSAIRTFQLAQLHRLHISIKAKVFAIKLIHIQLLFIIILGRISTSQSHLIILQIALPIAVWQPLAESQRHFPGMFSQLVERLIIKHTHQLCLGWLAVRSRHMQGPLLLLSRSETVAESLPGDIQFLFRQRTGDADFSGIAFAVLHETIVDHHTRSIFLSVGEWQGHDTVAQFPGAFLQQFVAGDDGINDMRSVFRRTHLHIYRLSIMREGLRRLVIPFGGWLHRMGILDAEEGELLLQGISSADCLQLMNAGFPDMGR